MVQGFKTLSHKLKPKRWFTIYIALWNKYVHMHVYNILKQSRSCSLMESQEQDTNPSLNLTPHLCFLCTWHSFETCLLIRSLPFCGLFIILLSACSYKKQLQHFVKNNKCIRVLSIFFLNISFSSEWVRKPNGLALEICHLRMATHTEGVLEGVSKYMCRVIFPLKRVLW